mmetsp:Transcript_27141/g.59737  ORF Transcript_27141/g.59737 Transcript_27141/m.59737 type:complete len:315 (-) Transcript_27141:66-1010(-)
MAKKKSKGTTARSGNATTYVLDDKKNVNKRNTNSNNTKKNSAPNKKNKSKSKNSDIDWITSLARENASNDNGVGAIPSKEDRKRKRESKKNRRLEQQKEKQLQQEQRRQSQSQGQGLSIGKLATKTKMAPPSAQHSSQREARSALLLEFSTLRIRRLSRTFKLLQKTNTNENAAAKTRFVPYYDLPKGSNPKAPRTSHASGIPKKRKRQKWSEDSIQPLRSDYSGIGLARESMYIEFLDPSCIPKLEEEFQEHIPGFFGKQRTKAMKKQTDGNMLWRRLANEKKNDRSKKFKGMSADERVKAMIDSTDRAGLLG